MFIEEICTFYSIKIHYFIFFKVFWAFTMKKCKILENKYLYPRREMLGQQSEMIGKWPGNDHKWPENDRQMSEYGRKMTGNDWKWPGNNWEITENGQENYYKWPRNYNGNGKKS